MNMQVMLSSSLLLFPHSLCPPSHITLYKPDARPRTSGTRRRRYASSLLLTDSKDFNFHVRAEATASNEGDDGPIELPPGPDPFDSGTEVSPLQAAAGFSLSGLAAFLLFRSLRRRAKQAKEQRLRSTVMTRKGTLSEAEEALKKLKLKQKEPLQVKKNPPSALQTLSGGLVAGLIAYLLYNLTSNVEMALSKQQISDNYSVQQITITIRTIVVGICYLATFIFAANSVGLTLYSGQLAFNSLFSDKASLSSSETNAEQNADENLSEKEEKL